jgi:hypothetical protein
MYATLTFEPDLADEQRATEPTEEEWKLARDQMSEQGMETFTELPSSLKKLMDK